MLKAQINANVKASMDKNANYAQELVDARVDDEGKTYPTAGDNIRAVGRVRSMQNIMKNWVIKNGYANQNGNLVASESWRVAHMVPVSGDEAKSGTNREHREEFNRMIKDAMDGKLDYIVTKSIPFGGASVRSGSGTVSRRRTVLPTRKRIAGARKAACQMRKRKLQTSAAPQNATMSVRWSRVSWNCSTA